MASHQVTQEGMKGDSILHVKVESDREEIRNGERWDYGGNEMIICHDSVKLIDDIVKKNLTRLKAEDDGNDQGDTDTIPPWGNIVCHEHPWSSFK